MKTVQMTLDDDLLRVVDDVVKQLKITRSAFAREALRKAVWEFKTRKLEQQHRRGYKIDPVKPGEFSVWEEEQE